MKKSFILRTGKPWVFIAISIYFLVNAIIGYFKDELNTLQYWGYIAYAIAFVLVLLYVLFVLTDLMGTASKVEIYNEGLLLKSRPFSSGRKITWEEIQSITFHHYQIDLKLDTEPVFFSYRCSSSVSKQIKDAIRDMAEMKQIPVTGG